MTEREQLELAAKAIGKTLEYCVVTDTNGKVIDQFIASWNPLTSQADSADLRDALEIEIEYGWGMTNLWVFADRKGTKRGVIHNGTPEDRSRAVREAVLMVATEIGRNK